MADRPVAILAWTLKGWRLPFAGDPLNHGAQLTGDQLAALRRELGVAGGRRVGAVPARQPRGALRAARHGRGHRPPAALPSAAARAHSRPARPAAAADHVDAGGLRRRPGRPRPAARPRLRAGHRVRRRDDHDAPVRVGQPARRLRDARAGRRLRAPRAPAPHSLEGVPGRPAPRAGDRGGVVLRPPVRPGSGPGALRPAAPADRHALRLLPAARPRPPAARHVLEGALHPRRQPLRHQPRPRGRRAPVGADPGAGDRGPEPPRLRAHVRTGGGVAPPGGAPGDPGPRARRGGLPPALDQDRRPGAPPAGPRPAGRGGAARPGAEGRVSPGRPLGGARVRARRERRDAGRGGRDGARRPSRRAGSSRPTGSTPTSWR